MHYYQHHIGDFDRATRHLTRIERSVYLDMIFLYYETETPLPLDVPMLCRKIVAREDAERAAVVAVLGEFFHETPGGWYHDRCEEELEKFRKSVSQASEAGKASARAKAERRQAAMQQQKPVEPQTKVNARSTTVEPTLNERGTEAQRTVNEPPTNHYPLSTNLNPEEKVNTNVAAIAPTPARSTEVEQVFSYWQLQRGHQRAKLDPKRERAIKARLKDGYSVADLCLAIDGIARSAHHMGQNDTRTVYDDIELICRDGPHVDGFMKKAEQPAGGAPRSANQQQTIDNLQRYLEKRHGT